ncbi:FAD-binding oxidoreductase [Paenibacillus sp. GYB006]
MMAIEAEKAFMLGLGINRVLLDSGSREKLSKDYYWYSPVLEKKLHDKLADGIIQPETDEEVVKVLEIAYAHQMPVTVRGAGTGNYGQAVPLNGGIVLDLSRLDRIVEWGEGWARVQCGVKLGVLEREARVRDRELRIYPSTYMKATVGGFVCGGSGGIGSITWGDLWDGNVLEATVYTMEEQPKKMIVSGDELHAYIHNYGTTGILTELVIPLAPKTEWTQSIVFFDDFMKSMEFSYTLSLDDSIRKRLVSPHEWPIPSFFRPIKKSIRQNQAAVLLETAEGTLPKVTELARSFGGEVGYSIPSEKYRSGIGLSDFGWNHTTLWALKCENNVTYLQAGFSLEHFREQIKLVKDTFQDEVLLHFEWMRSRGKVSPASLPIIRYTTEERLNEIIDFFNKHDIFVANPHTYSLDSGGRGILPLMKQRKLENDPLRLLNPGKID